jgi:WD40 repeat protein
VPATVQGVGLSGTRIQHTLINPDILTHRASLVIMNVDDEPSANLNPTRQGNIESCKQSDAMSVDHLPENGHSPSATVAKEQAISQLRPNYRAKFILSGHTMSISSLKFSPDGSLLASSGAFITSIQIESSDSILYRSKPPTS